MAGINTGKVVVGGVLAGFVFNIGDFVINTMLMAADFEQHMTRLGLDAAAMNSMAGIAPWIVIDFGLGLLVVWTYASMRPRFGPGVKTAVLAGLVPYLAITLVILGFTTMGMFTMPIFLKSSVLQFVNIMAGTIAGAWAYKEP
ncbi:MAG TPA: hypothetical protein VMO26_21205 [Vicinamibacterales bacterium]|nr:hypothetical protein [Vicinamibacterales bacterium]